MSEEFKDQLLAHAKKAIARVDKAQSEEATKQFLVIPFFQLLGYDPLDPDEIIPEADASFSDKFKNRVDYAICKEQEPVIAVEAKKVGTLSDANRGELKGYYNAVTTIKLGILTDGLIYQLYSDTDEENLMDDEPFAIVDLTQVAQEHIPDDALDALLKLRRGTFDPADIGADARRKIYISAYLDALEKAFKAPNEAFIRTLMDAANIEGRRTNKLIEEHKLIVSEAMNTFFDKKLLERVGFAEREDLVKVPAVEKQPSVANSDIIEQPNNESMKTSSSDIVTTETELEVYDYTRYRLSFLIDHDEKLFAKLSNVSFRDFKGIFAVFYKQDRKGRLFNFREGPNGEYRFEFPVTGVNIKATHLSEIDSEILTAFMRRIEELG